VKIDGLTPQQHRVATLKAKGLTDKEIGEILGISKKGVWFHLRRIADVWKLRGDVRVLIASKVNRDTGESARKLDFRQS